MPYMKNVTGKLVRDRIRAWLPPSLSSSPIPEFAGGFAQMLLWGGAPTIAIGYVGASLVKGVLAAFGVGADAVTAADLDLWRSGIKKTTQFNVDDFFGGRSGYRIPDTLGRRTDANIIPYVAQGGARGIDALMRERATKYLIDGWTSYLEPTTNRRAAKLFVFFELLPQLNHLYGVRIFRDTFGSGAEIDQLKAGLEEYRALATDHPELRAEYNSTIQAIQQTVVLPPGFRVADLTRAWLDGFRFYSWLSPPFFAGAGFAELPPCTCEVEGPPPDPHVAIKIAPIPECDGCDLVYTEAPPGDTTPGDTTPGDTTPGDSIESEVNQFMSIFGSAIWTRRTADDVPANVELLPGASYQLRYKLPEEYEPTAWTGPISLTSAGIVGYISEAQLLSDGRTLVVKVTMQAPPGRGSVRGATAASPILIAVGAVAILSALGFAGYQATSILDRVERILKNPLVWALSLTAIVVTLRVFWKASR